MRVITRLGEVLEAKRRELNMSKNAFAMKAGIDRTNTAAFYWIILNGRSPLPPAKFEKVAEVLGISVQELSVLVRESWIRSKGNKQVAFNGDELRYLAGIADAAGRKLPIDILLAHLEHMPNTAKD